EQAVPEGVVLAPRRAEVEGEVLALGERLETEGPRACAAPRDAAEDRVLAAREGRGRVADRLEARAARLAVAAAGGVEPARSVDLPEARAPGAPDGALEPWHVVL